VIAGPIIGRDFGRRGFRNCSPLSAVGARRPQDQTERQPRPILQSFPSAAMSLAL
jgi:hypothetical protein